jgi:hypothetical protein
MPWIHKTKIWRVQVPEGWKKEGSGDAVMFFDPEGVGILHLHVDTHAPKDIDPARLLAYARSCSVPGTDFRTTMCGSLQGVTGVVSDRGTHCQVWRLKCGTETLFASYQCAAKNSAAEIAKVVQILQTLEESDRPTT